MNHLSYSIGLPSLPKFVTVAHGSFYSYSTARTFSDLGSVECRLFFAEEVMTALEARAEKEVLRTI